MSIATDYRRLLLTLLVSIAVLSSAPVSARGVKECIDDAAGITAADEAGNATIDGLAEAADAGIPVMDPGIVLSLNQVNVNLADLLGPLTVVAKETCETNDTLSTAAAPADFVGWTDVVDTEPQPQKVPGQIDGRRSGSSPFTGPVKLEDDANLREMEADKIDGSSQASITNERQGLRNMIAMALDGVSSEQQALAGVKNDRDKPKLARNVKDLIAMLLEEVDLLTEAQLRGNIERHQERAELAQMPLFEAGRQKMIQDDHTMTRRLLMVGA